MAFLPAAGHSKRLCVLVLPSHHSMFSTYVSHIQNHVGARLQLGCTNICTWEGPCTSLACIVKPKLLLCHTWNVSTRCEHCLWSVPCQHSLLSIVCSPLICINCLVSSAFWAVPCQQCIVSSTALSPVNWSACILVGKSVLYFCDTNMPIYMWVLVCLYIGTFTWCGQLLQCNVAIWQLPVTSSRSF